MTRNVPLPKLLELLKGAATLGIVRRFLRDRGLASSGGSWDKMIDDRLVPAVEAGDIQISDLLGLLRECEEHGRQHVFVYRIAAKYKPPCLDPENLKKALAQIGMEKLLESPRLLDMPATQQLCDVRIETAPRRAVVIKAVEKRVYWEPAGTRMVDGRMVREYDPVEERAVSVARVGRDGLVEIRIHRQKTTNDYRLPLEAFWELIAPLIDRKKCGEVSLAPAKKYLFDNRDSLSDRIAMNQLGAKNPYGNESRILAGDPRSNLAEDKGSIDGMKAFLAESGQHTSSHWTWLPTDESSHGLHVALHGRAYEFAIGQGCMQEQYERIFSDILEFNE